ncbi:MFS transporter [Nocardia otitidiscaviarum]|uniref:MFS transporter n=1 Tax=Nocardia otitidiscaviarum TaxID=1823 RepID=UPI0024576F39|nr:MFS transporter [Nocardia otitidiscaviarum]
MGTIHEREPDLPVSTADSEAAPPVQRTRWMTIVTSALATLVVAGELAMAAFTLPLIGAEFGVGEAATVWVLLAYQLPLAAFALSAGRWVDRIDTRLAFFGSLAGVAVTSAIAGLAPSFWVLLAMRPLQGLAAATYMAVYLPVIVASVREDQRARAVSYHATVMLVGSVAEGPLGGLIADVFGWRAVFLVKVPLLALMIALGYFTIPARRKMPNPPPADSISRRSLLAEAILAGIGLTALLLALQRVGQGWAVSVVLVVVAVISLGWWFRLPGSRPVIALIRHRTIGLSTLALMLNASIIGLLVFSLPFFISDVLHRGPGLQGGVLLCFVAAGALVAPIAGTLADRFGSTRVAAIGSAVIVIGLIPMVFLGSDAEPIDLFWRVAVLGAGMALFNSPNLATILNAAPQQRAGTVGGLSTVARSVGTTLGPAVAAMAWSLQSGGVSGFRLAAVILAGLTGVAFAALLGALRAA